jgi:hypothetical protein
MGWEPFFAAGIALWPFSSNGPHQIALNRGDVVLLLEHYVPPLSSSSTTSDSAASWYRGSIVGNCFTKTEEAKPPSLGIFPSSFIRLTSEEGELFFSFLASFT